MAQPRPPRSAAQISRLIQQQIETGALGPGDALLSSRAMAAELGVSRTTVMAALRRLRVAGLIDMRQGAPARVCRALSTNQPAPRPVEAPPHLSAFGMALSVATSQHPPHQTPEFDFRPGFDAADLFPATEWRRAMARAARPPADPPALRAAVQAYLKRARDIDCPADQIVVLPHIAQARDLCLRILTNPGEAVIVPDPGPPQLREMLAVHGLQCLPARTDTDGPYTTGVAARLACVAAAHHDPLGGVLGAEHRHDLQRWATRNEAYVLDEEGTGAYRYDSAPVTPLFSTAPNARTLHLGDFGHVLQTVSDLCYLLVPPALVPAVTAAQDLLGAQISAAAQGALTQLLNAGTIERHIRRLRRRLALRHAALISSLSRLKIVQVRPEPAGLHLVAWLADVPVSQEQMFCHMARGAGLGLTPLSACEGPGPRRERSAAVLMGFARMEPVRIELGVTRLEKQLRAFRS